MKKKATKKQTQQVLEGLIGDIQAIYQREVNTENVISLYLEYKNDADGFNKFLEDKAKKNEADSKKRA